MVKDIAGHKVEMYDGIEELPVARFHKYQRFLLVDAGVGADISAFDRRIERMRRYMLQGKADKAVKEMDNLRQCVFMMQGEISPKCKAFACLVSRIDGKPCDDLSDEGLQRVIDILGATPASKLAALLEAVKKKIDTELTLYFPELFNGSEVREYYDILRRRTLGILKGIAEGKDDPAKEVEELTTKLVTWGDPGAFSGQASEEIRFDRQFEDICVSISEQLHTSPKSYTVLEFYNAYDYLRRKAKESERQAKRRH